MSRARRAARDVAIGLVTLVAAVVGWRFASRERPEATAARIAVDAGRIDEAERLLDAWTVADPRSGEPDYYRALLDLRTNRPVEGLDAMRRSIAKGYPEGPILVLRAILMARAGKLAEAEPTLATAFQEASEPRSEVAEGLSRIYLRTFRLGEAIKVLDAWSKFAPDDARPYLRRVDIDERINSEPAVLIRDYREALRRDPGLVDARLGLAEKLREAALNDEAEAEYATLLELDPRNVRGLAGAGRIALLKGDLAASVGLFERVLAVDPKDKAALRELGLIDMNNGRLDRACSRLKAAVEADPYDPEARYSYSRALKLAGDAPRAAEEAAATDRLRQEQQKIVDLRQSLVQRPDDVDLRSDAARWLIEHGHEKEGLEWTGLILRQRPGHPATCRLLADYHAKRGEPGLANFYRLAASPGP